MDDEERCPIPECDRPVHDGLHTDADGFRWGQSPREAAEDRADEWANSFDAERALEGMP